LKEVEAVAPALGVTPLFLEVKGADDIERAFTAMKKERTGAVLVGRTVKARIGGQDD
jgi:hypothetical protein